MKIGRILTLGLGLGIGFILGSRSGRDSYERMKDEARRIWEDPKVQSTIHEVTERAPEAFTRVAETVKESLAESTGEQPAEEEMLPHIPTMETQHLHDVVSDPGLGEGINKSDWASEGGATRR